MAEHSQERTEQATPRRRQEARHKGTVARSIDLTSSMVLLSLSLFLPVLAVGLVGGLMEGLRASFEYTTPSIGLGDVLDHVYATAMPMFYGFLPMAFIALFVGVGVSFAQVGFHPSLEPLAPKFSRINPIEGFKRLFSKRAAFEFMKTLIKLFVIMYIAWHEVSSREDELFALSGLTPQQGIASVAHLCGAILLKVALAWLVLGVLDYFYQRWETEKSMKMTKDELRKELKEQEVSPELRMELHRRRQRLARARMMASVKQADVVITNPVEYAVALKYDPKKHPAPLCLAKGRHLIAEKIRDEAKKNRVPIVPNPPLARSLYDQVDIGETIPTALFQATAEVLAYVFKQKGKMI